MAGVVGPPYKVGPRCSAPQCNRPVDHGHHIFRRSALGGAFFWVQLPDGQVVGNLTGLCAPCHDRVTGELGGHRSWIRWRAGRYVWGDVPGDAQTPPDFDLDFVEVGPLDPQPPAPEILDVSQPEAVEPDRCPQCGHPRRRAPALPTAGARRRKTWTVKVPDDHEDGADILDTLVDDLAPLLGIDPTASGRYHVLVPVLVYAQQDKREFTRAIAGVGGHPEEG